MILSSLILVSGSGALLCSCASSSYTGRQVVRTLRTRPPDFYPQPLISWADSPNVTDHSIGIGPLAFLQPGRSVLFPCLFFKIILRSSRMSMSTRPVRPIGGLLAEQCFQLGKSCSVGLTSKPYPWQKKQMCGRTCGRPAFVSAQFVDDDDIASAPFSRYCAGRPPRPAFSKGHTPDDIGSRSVQPGHRESTAGLPHRAVPRDATLARSQSQ